MFQVQKRFHIRSFSCVSVDHMFFLMFFVSMFPVFFFLVFSFFFFFSFSPVSLSFGAFHVLIVHVSDRADVVRSDGCLFNRGKATARIHA